MALSAHGSEDQLEQYALGRLSEQETALLEEHLLACAACRDKVDSFDEVSIGMREALVKDSLKAEGGFAGRLAVLVRRPAFAMTVAFVILLAVIGMFSRRKPTFVPVATLQLTAVRGEMATTVPARNFDVTLTDGPRDGGVFRAEVVNAVGAAQWRGLAQSGPAGVHMSVNHLLPEGDYFLRLYEPSGAVMREYGFRVRN